MRAKYTKRTSKKRGEKGKRPFQNTSVGREWGERNVRRTKGKGRKKNIRNNYTHIYLSSSHI